MLNLKLFLVSFYDELMDEVMAVGVVTQPKASPAEVRQKSRGGRNRGEYRWAQPQHEKRGRCRTRIMEPCPSFCLTLEQPRHTRSLSPVTL